MKKSVWIIVINTLQVAGRSCCPFNLERAPHVMTSPAVSTRRLFRIVLLRSFELEMRDD